jgi:NADPH:quinone reductase-like Zn-dependent oxidoreductase
MKIEELLFRLSQAWEDWNWRMEQVLAEGGARLSSAALQVRSSTAGEQYRLLVAAMEELVAKLQKNILELRVVNLLLESARATGDELMVKMAWATPFFRSLPRDKIVLVSLSLLLGFLSGRSFSSSVPRLKPIFMISTVCGSYSGVPGIAQCRIEVPRIQSSDELLIRVMSASLDRTDILSLTGWGRVDRRKMYGGFTLGRDFCGVVVEAGAKVPHLQPGDKVWGAVPYNLPGTMSEMVVLPGRFVEKMPNNLDWDGAATVPYSALMVWSAMVWKGGLKPDKCEGLRVLVLDGVSDTGCLATQLACLWGCMVTVLCSSRTVPLAHALGAQCVVAARETAEECVQDLEESGPFNLIVVAGDMISETSCLPLLSEKGRICSTLPPTLSSDTWGLFRRIFLPLWRSIVLPPSVPSSRNLAQPLKYITGAVESGKIQPVLDSVLSPADIKQGLSRLASEGTVGKSVLVFDKI